MKKSKLPNLISVMILTLITSLMWISFNIYRALTSQTPPSVPGEVSEPLTPTLDKDAISQIEGKLFLNDAQIPDNVAIGTPPPSVAPIPEETLIASPTPIAVEATPSPTPTP